MKNAELIEGRRRVAEMQARQKSVLTAALRECDLRPRIACPRCGDPPAHRISEVARDLFRALDPTEPVATIQCGHCRTIYPITAGAYGEAGPVTTSGKVRVWRSAGGLEAAGSVWATAAAVR